MMILTTTTGYLIELKGKNKFKYILIDLLSNADKINKDLWNDILWLTSDQRIGVDRDQIFYIFNHKKRRYSLNQFDVLASIQEYFMQLKLNSFFNSESFKSLDYVLAIKRMNDFRLLYKTNLSAQDIINCENQAIKRELLTIFGYKRLLTELNPIIIDKNGSSVLLKIESAIEPILLIKVIDPSTGDQYLLRVPPITETCQQAIAWTFNLEANKYNPVLET